MHVINHDGTRFVMCQGVVIGQLRQSKMDGLTLDELQLHTEWGAWANLRINGEAKPRTFDTLDGWERWAQSKCRSALYPRTGKKPNAKVYTGGWQEWSEYQQKLVRSARKDQDPWVKWAHNKCTNGRKRIAKKKESGTYDGP